MYSVVLTELGISVFNDGKLDKAFSFSNPVKEYLLVKNKESKLNELVNYLASTQRGFSVSDESLLAILKKYSIDCHLMEESELDEIQTNKPQIIVDSGFASNLQDTLGKLREFALGLSSSKVTEVSESPDLHIIQAINSLDEIDKIANGLSSRLREWYGLHFPELDNIIDSINGYAQIVLAGKRESLTKQIFEEAGFPESKVEMLSLISSKSRGGDISDINLSIVQSIAKQVLDFHELRKKLEEHVEAEMQEIAPNTSAILGTAVGARILGRAGSLKKMASLPASTIQVLGAEKALFRSLKTGSQPPKHGLLFQHAMVHAAPRWQRGKIARAVAAKAVIAARVDVYGEGLNQTLLEKLNIRVDEIGKKYENPTEKDMRPPPSFRREGGFGDKPRRREGGDRRREGGDRRREGGDRRREGGDRRREGGDRRREGGDRRREGGFRDNPRRDRREGGFRDNPRRDSGDRREGGFRDNPRRDSGDRREGGFRDNPRRDSGRNDERTDSNKKRKKFGRR
ncbi:NOP5/NOP56 family protein [Nitrosopumilus oxyclinae]|uniref:NOP5/NOP56 family protein n=1 Tax=Nitrosopumilus oxyclinae TaxID=1959104 RepID=UPI001FEB18B7|nr:ribonucleotide-diphosphate reductase subunit beta [Nitrosopumilus oxyclinae]